MKLRTNGQITWLESAAWRQTGLVSHAFSTRLGGASDAVCHGMNFGYQSDDPASYVTENRRLFVRHFDADPERVINPKLVHGRTVLAVDGSHLSRRFLDPEVEPIYADGLVTREPGLALFFTFADCVPLIYFDPYERVIAAIHAGWRGVMENVALEGVRVMVEDFDCDPAHIQVLIGPHAGAFDYEIDEPVIEALMVHTGAWMDLLRESRPGHAFFDMERTLIWQLGQAGIDRERIETAGLSTIRRHDLFYSHRRGHTPGKLNAAMVMLR